MVLRPNSIWYACAPSLSAFCCSRKSGANTRNANGMMNRAASSRCEPTLRSAAARIVRGGRRSVSGTVAVATVSGLRRDEPLARRPTVRRCPGRRPWPGPVGTPRRRPRRRAGSGPSRRWRPRGCGRAAERRRRRGRRRCAGRRRRSRSRWQPRGRPGQRTAVRRNLEILRPHPAARTGWSWPRRVPHRRVAHLTPARHRRGAQRAAGSTYR